MSNIAYWIVYGNQRGLGTTTIFNSLAKRCSSSLVFNLHKTERFIDNPGLINNLRGLDVSIVYIESKNREQGLQLYRLLAADGYHGPVHTVEIDKLQFEPVAFA